MVCRGEQRKMPDKVLVDSFSPIRGQKDKNLRRCHFANRDDLIIEAFADHLKDLDNSNLADQRHLPEIENLKQG